MLGCRQKTLQRFLIYDIKNVEHKIIFLYNISYHKNIKEKDIYAQQRYYSKIFRFLQRYNR